MNAQGMPLLFSGSVTLSAGGTLAVDMKESASKSRLPVLIDEIRFLVRSPVPLNDTSKYDLGPYWRAEIDLAGRALTDGYIPIWSFSPQIQTQEFIGGLKGSANGVSTNAPVYSIYRWRFPRPLYVPSSATLITRMHRSADYDSIVTDLDPTASATAVVTYAARALPADFQVPKTIDVPYCSNWIATSTLSPDNALRNVFRTPLHIERFIGHISASDTVAGDSSIRDENRVAPHNQFASGWSAATRRNNIQMKLSSGFAITPDPTPFYRVFDPQTSCFPAKLTLNHQERVHVRLFDAPSNTYRPHISMVGYREERIA